MVLYQTSQAFPEHGPAPSPDTVSPGEYEYESPLTDRNYGWHSSAGSINDGFSAVPYPDYGAPPLVPHYAVGQQSTSNDQWDPYPPAYPLQVLDPFTQAGSTPLSFPTNALTCPLSANQDLEMDDCPQDKDRITLPPFDIEAHGDPKIHWFMYYDFNVNKTEAYWELQEGYKITVKYPLRREVEKSFTIGGKRIHPCRFKDCRAKPFGRHHDLERHFRTVHSDPRTVDSKNVDEVQCDYPGCNHANFLRKDHAREHYREYHKDDLPKKTPSKREPEKHKGELKKWWDDRVIKLKWWRCSGCLRRVRVSESDYLCPLCDKQCEAERIQFRMKFLGKRSPKDLQGPALSELA